MNDNIDIEREWGNFSDKMGRSGAEYFVPPDTVPKLRTWLEAPYADMPNKQEISDFCTVLRHCPDGLCKPVEIALVNKYRALSPEDKIPQVSLERRRRKKTPEEIANHVVPIASRQIALMLMETTTSLRMSLESTFFHNDVRETRLTEDEHQLRMERILAKMPDNNSYGYITRAIKNMYVDELRRRKTRRTDEFSDFKSARLSDPSTNPERMFELAETRDSAARVAQYTEALPRTQRAVFKSWMHNTLNGESATQGELAASIKLNEKTFRNNLSQARKKMQDWLNNGGPPAM